MSPTYFALSRYRAMWLFVCFDLPVETKLQRKHATGFRKNLLKDGFTMMQFSVYIRPCPTDENMAVHVARVKAFTPDEGMVSILRVTDRQFSQIVNIVGAKREPLPPAPVQLELF